MVGKKDAADAQPPAVLDAGIVGDEKASKAAGPKPKDKAGKTAIVKSDKGPQLSAEQQKVFDKLRAEILEAKKDKGLEFFIRVGGLVVDAIGDEEKRTVDKDHAVLRALGKDESVNISQSNLWYATQLVDQHTLFGDAAPHLSASHKRRLLHAPADQRQALAAQVVKDKLTVVETESLIKAKKKKPTVDGKGKGPRGAKPLSDAAKFFSPFSSAVEKFGDIDATDLKGLSAKKAKTFYDNAQVLRKLVEEWLPTFEAELKKIAKIES